ncbi:DUF3021 family protein [Weissella muntiaci]|uniref:DUF3021 family protein n=1 Tax=Weissella muntiaci TaxID=2508881 RepID=A0A6C2C5V1_9LACO|nr:DUF3021 family protein [Weissella muntiaci]TYC49089.1 DUF3021 family protein [Weissella muntiaci]
MIRQILRHFVVGMIFGSFSQMLVSVFTGYVETSRSGLAASLILWGIIGISVMVFDHFDKTPRTILYGLHFLFVVVLIYSANMAFNSVDLGFDWLTIRGLEQMLIATVLIYALNVGLSIYVFRKQVSEINRLIK